MNYCEVNLWVKISWKDSVRNEKSDILLGVRSFTGNCNFISVRYFQDVVSVKEAFEETENGSDLKTKQSSRPLIDRVSELITSQ